MFRLAIASAFLILAPLGAALAQPLDHAAVDAIVDETLKGWKSPGLALAIIRGDSVIHLKGYGVKELGEKDSVTPDTLFPIASCTKAFTTTALAMLADDGKLAWDDPVRKHVAYFHLSDPLADANVTLRDLVTHRTGVGSHELLWYRAPWGREEVIRRIGLVKPKYSFRSTFHYQTTMFTAAGVAVETAAKRPWEEFVHKRIFEPLEMRGANFTTSAAQKAADRASGHRKGPGGIEVIPWYKIDRPEPAGSINASARDLGQWAIFHLGKGVYKGRCLVSAANLTETHSPQTIIRLEGNARAMNPETNQLSYGMGWVIQDYRGRLLVSHAGAIDGFRAHITLAPNDNLALVLLNNLERTQMNLALSNTLLDYLLGLPKKDWHDYVQTQVKKQEDAAREQYAQRERSRRVGTRPSRDLAAYAGTYEHPAYGMATVLYENAALLWKWSTFSVALEHFHFDTFTADNDLLGQPLVTFTLGGDGDVATMKISEPLDVEFKKTASKSKHKRP